MYAEGSIRKKPSNTTDYFQIDIPWLLSSIKQFLACANIHMKSICHEDLILAILFQ